MEEICVSFYGGKRNVENVTFSFVKDYKHIWKWCMFSCIKMVNIYLKLCLNIFCQLESFFRSLVARWDLTPTASESYSLFGSWSAVTYLRDTSANIATWALKTLWISAPQNTGILLGLHGLAGWRNLQKLFAVPGQSYFQQSFRGMDLRQSEIPLYLLCRQLWPVISTIHLPKQRASCHLQLRPCENVVSIIALESCEDSLVECGSEVVFLGKYLTWIFGWMRQRSCGSLD